MRAEVWKRQRRRPTAQSGAPPHHWAAAPLARPARVAVFILGGFAGGLFLCRYAWRFFELGRSGEARMQELFLSSKKCIEPDQKEEDQARL